VYLRWFRTTGDPQEAVLESTAAHTAYNAVIFLVALVAIILTAAQVA